MFILTVEFKFIVHISDKFQVNRELSLYLTMPHENTLVG